MQMSSSSRPSPPSPRGPVGLWPSLAPAGCGPPPPHAALVLHPDPSVNVASIHTDCRSSGRGARRGLGWPHLKTRQLGPGSEHSGTWGEGLTYTFLKN